MSTQPEKERRDGVVINKSSVFAATTHHCPIYKSNIGIEQCQWKTKVLRDNESSCCSNECSSPWRVCLACLRQGYQGRDNLVVNPLHGFCAFHKANGPKARRGEEVNDEVYVVELPVQKKRHKVVGEVLEVPCSRIKPFKGQPREYFDPVALKRLERSIEVRGQLQPALVKKLQNDSDHDFELIEGQRRWHCCTNLDIPLRVEVRKVADVEDQFEQSIIANFLKEGHTPLEKARGIDRLLKNGRTWNYVAECFGESITTISNYHKLLKLHPDIQARLEYSFPEDKRMPISVAFALADLPVAEQLSALKKIDEDGLNVNQAREEIRRHGQSIGVHIGGERSPKSDFRILQTYLGNVPVGADRFLRMNRGEIEAMFKFRSSGDLPLVIKRVEDALDVLRKLKGVLQKVGRNEKIA